MKVRIHRKRRVGDGSGGSKWMTVARSSEDISTALLRDTLRHELESGHDVRVQVYVYEKESDS